MKKSSNNLKFAILATDIVVLTIKDNKLLVRLQEVNRPPYFDAVPGLPGGLISPTETAEETVRRLLSEKARLNPSKVYIEQLYTFSALDRDPRGRVVSVAYLALVPWEDLTRLEQQDTEEVWWEEVRKIKNLAYDHRSILSTAIKRLQSRITYTTLSSKLAPTEFTLTHLEKIYEVILKKSIDKRNFRKKLISLNIVKKTEKKVQGVKYRPPNLYSFSTKNVSDLSIL
jgi:8-oxo-dGTP diphosphatase